MGCWAGRILLRCPLPGPLTPRWKLLETTGAFPTEMGSQSQLRYKMRQEVRVGRDWGGGMRDTPTAHLLLCACASCWCLGPFSGPVSLASGKRISAEGGSRPRPQMGPLLCGPPKDNYSLLCSPETDQGKDRGGQAQRTREDRHGGRCCVSPAAETGDSS